MTAEPGWYHAAGDPPGTVRLWNGSDWVGFPQRDPNVPLAETQVSVGGPAHGQQRLKPFGILAMITMLGPAAAYGYQAVAMLRSYQLLGTFPEGTALIDVINAYDNTPDIEEVLAMQVVAMMAIGFTSLIAGVFFIMWFFVAYMNLGKWARTKYESWWAIVAWIVPFIQLKRPSEIMQELCESSPRADQVGAINPVVAWAWWLGWIAGSAAVRLLNIWAIRESDLTTVRMILIISMALCLVNVACAFCAIRLIQQISHHQDLRFQRKMVASGSTALAQV